MMKIDSRMKLKSTDDEHLVMKFGDFGNTEILVGVHKDMKRNVVLTTTELICLCCNESVIINPSIQLVTLEEFVRAFKIAHDKLGCTEEKYIKNKTMEDV